MFDKARLQKIDNYTWEILKDYRKAMKVPARIFASEKMLDLITRDKSLDQLVNTATLPSLHKYVLAMPDIHQGYGVPVGGVLASDLDKDPIISPGAIGFDIDCGVRVLVSNVQVSELKDKIKNLAVQIQRDVPSGLGKGRKQKYSFQNLENILRQGPEYLVNKDIGRPDDLEMTEENGRLTAADAAKVSDRAKQRGTDQVGTLGSGNHFLELQEVIQIFEKETANTFGLMKGQLCAMVHSGSRGLGHQVASDYIKKALQWIQKQGIKLADRELAYLPFNSQAGQDYWAAMSAAANFAWANRHTMGHLVRQSFQKILGDTVKVSTLYDVAHNIAKIETHERKSLLVHRKGATRAFWAGHPQIPAKYQKVGQPVLIPGSMGTSSWILVGDRRAEQKSFGTACHGAGRTMSRTQAKKQVQGAKLKQELENQGIVVQGGSMAGLAEEAPLAYKDVDEVVEVVHNVGIARKVAQLKPVAVIKG